MDFDTEKFITEVQNRPAIWNTKLENADRCTKQSDWAELAERYGPKLSKQEKKRLAVNLQKKWRNIRDNFVKAHKTINGNPVTTKRRKRYIYYKNLLFLEHTLSGNTPVTAVPSVETTLKTEEIDDLSEDVSESDPLTDDCQKYTTVTASSSWTPNRIIINNRNDDSINTDSIGGLNRNLQINTAEDNDDDRLFFLSLVKEFKRIPDHMQIQAKLDILRLIKDAQYSH